MNFLFIFVQNKQWNDFKKVIKEKKSLRQDEECI